MKTDDDWMAVIARARATMQKSQEQRRQVGDPDAPHQSGKPLDRHESQGLAPPPGRLDLATVTADSSPTIDPESAPSTPRPPPNITPTPQGMSQPSDQAITSTHTRVCITAPGSAAPVSTQPTMPTVSPPAAQPESQAGPSTPPSMIPSLPNSARIPSAAATKHEPERTLSLHMQHIIARARDSQLGKTSQVMGCTGSSSPALSPNWSPTRGPLLLVRKGEHKSPSPPSGSPLAELKAGRTFFPLPSVYPIIPRLSPPSASPSNGQTSPSERVDSMPPSIPSAGVSEDPQPLSGREVRQELRIGTERVDSTPPPAIPSADSEDPQPLWRREVRRELRVGARRASLSPAPPDLSPRRPPTHSSPPRFRSPITSPPPQAKEGEVPGDGPPVRQSLLEVLSQINVDEESETPQPHHPSICALVNLLHLPPDRLAVDYASLDSRVRAFQASRKNRVKWTPHPKKMFKVREEVDGSEQEEEFMDLRRRHLRAQRDEERRQAALASGEASVDGKGFPVDPEDTGPTGVLQPPRHPGAESVTNATSPGDYNPGPPDDACPPDPSFEKRGSFKELLLRVHRKSLEKDAANGSNNAEDVGNNETDEDLSDDMQPEEVGVAVGEVESEDTPPESSTPNPDRPVPLEGPKTNSKSTPKKMVHKPWTRFPKTPTKTPKPPPADTPARPASEQPKRRPKRVPVSPATPTSLFPAPLPPPSLTPNRGVGGNLYLAEKRAREAEEARQMAEAKWKKEETRKRWAEAKRAAIEEQRRRREDANRRKEEVVAKQQGKAARGDQGREEMGGGDESRVTQERGVSFGFKGTGVGAGIKVQRIEPGSLAACAGMTIGDVVMKVQGKPVASSAELDKATAICLAPGSRLLTFTVIRSNQKVMLTAAFKSPQ